MFEIITVGAFAIACIMGAFSPGWALALVMSMYAFEQALQASSGIFLRILPLANICVAVSVGLCAFRCISSQNRPFVGYITSVWICFVFILLWSTISLLWTPAFQAALGLTTWGLPYVILFLVISPILIDDITVFTKFFRAFLILGSTICAIILTNPEFTFLSGRLGVNLDAIVRTNPLAMGELGGTLMLVAALFQLGFKSFFFNILRISAFLLGTILALQSGSRGQILFAVILSVAFYPLSTKVKNILGFIGTSVGLLILIPLVLILAQKILGSAEIRRWDADIIAGGTNVRIANVLDLLNAFLQHPVAWFIGLGSNAFTAVTSAGSEPYSHVLFIDILTELGIPMFILLGIILSITILDSRWLFRRFTNDPLGRASISVLLALLVYQIFLVNKQGYLWAATSFYFYIVAITRLRMRTEFADAQSDMFVDEESTSQQELTDGASFDEAHYDSETQSR